MKKIWLALMISCCTVASGTRVWALETEEIVTRAKEAVSQLNSVRLNGKTITAAVHISTTEGAIDYANKQFYAIEKSDTKTISTLYSKGATTYMYNGIVDGWFKFGPDVKLFNAVLEKEKLFSSFPDRAAERGFEVKNLGEEEIGGHSCYIVQSIVADQERAKKYIMESLDAFISEEIRQQMLNDKEMLDQYLDSYTQYSETTHWISKETFFVVKTLNKFKQITGPGESVSVDAQVTYSGFNEPVEIEIPQVALDAKTVTAAELGLAPAAGESPENEAGSGAGEQRSEPAQKSATENDAIGEQENSSSAVPDAGVPPSGDKSKQGEQNDARGAD